MTKVRNFFGLVITVVVLAVLANAFGGNDDGAPDLDPDERLVQIHFTAVHPDAKKVGRFDAMGLVAASDVQITNGRNGHVESRTGRVGALYVVEMTSKSGILLQIGCKITSNGDDITNISYSNDTMMWAKCTGTVPA